MGTIIKKINKSVGGLLRNSKNLQLLTGLDKFAAQRLIKENDVCCGLGRKVLYIAKAEGLPTTVTKYPIWFNNQKITSKAKFEEALNTFFGVGYLAYLSGIGNVTVLAAPYLKQADGTLDIADFVVVK